MYPRVQMLRGVTVRFQGVSPCIFSQNVIYKFFLEKEVLPREKFGSKLLVWPFPSWEKTLKDVPWGLKCSQSVTLRSPGLSLMCFPQKTKYLSKRANCIPEKLRQVSLNTSLERQYGAFVFFVLSFWCPCTLFT